MQVALLAAGIPLSLDLVEHQSGLCASQVARVASMISAILDSPDNAAAQGRNRNNHGGMETGTAGHHAQSHSQNVRPGHPSPLCAVALTAHHKLAAQLSQQQSNLGAHAASGQIVSELWHSASSRPMTANARTNSATLTNNLHGYSSDALVAQAHTRTSRGPVPASTGRPRPMTAEGRVQHPPCDLMSHPARRVLATGTRGGGASRNPNSSDAGRLVELILDESLLCASLYPDQTGGSKHRDIGPSAGPSASTQQALELLLSDEDATVSGLQDHPGLVIYTPSPDVRHASGAGAVDTVAVDVPAASLPTGVHVKSSATSASEPFSGKGAAGVLHLRSSPLHPQPHLRRRPVTASLPATAGGYFVKALQ